MIRTLVLHFHELWLKGGNRDFFLARLLTAVRQSLQPLPARVWLAHSRILVEVPEPDLEAAVERLRRVFGVAYFAVTRPAEKKIEAIVAAAVEEVVPRPFDSFAVRARRDDKTFPLRSSEVERFVGGVLLARLREAGHSGARVNLGRPGLTCHIEIARAGALIYSEKLRGPGGMPANTAGRLSCMLSGGFDSAVAAYKVMKRGVHLSFVHFHGTRSRAGESSEHVARELVRVLVPYQFTARLYLVPFEAIQRKIVVSAPEPYRVLLYRRMMLRITERIARREHARGVVTGDSISQVASQTIHNLQAVGSVARLPVYRPLIGDDKVDIIHLAEQIGTYAISAEPFQDCCPLFLPRSPALHARPEQLDAAEAALDVDALAREGAQSAVREKYEYRGGVVSLVPAAPSRVTSDK